MKIKLDGGGGSFKICLNIIDQVSPGQSPVKKQPNIGGSTTQFSNAGVKKLFILDIAHDVQELYDNIEAFVNALQLSSLQLCVCADLKLANILFGLQGHASKFPCTWCQGTSRRKTPARLRTLGRINLYGKVSEVLVFF